jgi:hypothetical protein
MRATVVEFPHRQASAHYLASPSKAARPQVIRFPDPRDSLTTHDLDVLTELTSSAQTRWCLETMRDGDWNLSAFIASRWGTGNYAATSRAPCVPCSTSGLPHCSDRDLSPNGRLEGRFVCSR